MQTNNPLEQGLTWHLSGLQFSTEGNRDEVSLEGSLEHVNHILSGSLLDVEFHHTKLFLSFLALNVLGL